MKSQVLTMTDLSILPTIAIVIFVAVFVGAIVRAFRPSARLAYETRALAPLEDDEQYATAAGTSDGK